MARRKTHEEFVAEVKALVGEEYTVLGKYSFARIEVEMRHNVCGRTWEVYPYNFKTGTRCPDCSILVRGRKRRKSHEKFLSEIPKQTSLKILGTYEKRDTPIRVFCEKCFESYDTTPATLILGCGCKCCWKGELSKKFMKDVSDFKCELREKTKEEVVLLGEYKGAHVEALFKNLKCCHEFYSTPASVLYSNVRCNKCRVSKGEARVISFLENYCIPYEYQKRFEDCVSIKPLPFDFFVQGVAIEYDGHQHFETVDYFGGEKEFEATQRRDAIKTQYCADNGIHLIRIPYWEFDNIDAILTEKLLPLLTETNVA